MGFSLFRASSGGSALSGNDLYVIDNGGGPSNYHTLHLDNTTQNATGVGATFTINWGDGSSVQTITTDNAAGGAGGSAGRLSHQWADGTSSGTSTDNVTLTITNHTTTDPSEIPKAHQQQSRFIKTILLLLLTLELRHFPMFPVKALRQDLHLDLLQMV